MNVEAVREKLAATVGHRENCAYRMWPTSPCNCWSWRELQVVALLPVVREIAAEELREAADDWDLRGLSLTAGELRYRADALTKPPDGPVR